jgi:hypothetical protein
MELPNELPRPLFPEPEPIPDWVVTVMKRGCRRQKEINWVEVLDNARRDHPE